MRHGTWFLVGWAVLIQVSLAEAAPKEGEKKEPHKVKLIKAADHSKKDLDMAKEEHRQELLNALASGNVEELAVEHGKPSPIAITWDLGLWTVVVFVLLLIILRKYAWGPMLEGLKKREDSIRLAVEEAKIARSETEKQRTLFQKELDEAYQKIPAMMDEARRDADRLKEEMRAATQTEIQTERQRLRREIEVAKDQALQDLWNQTAQLAAQISARVIRRELSPDDHSRLIDESMEELTKANVGFRKKVPF